MHSARFLLPALLALAAAGCAQQQQQQAYMIDPATGRATPVLLQQQPAQPQYAQQGYAQQPSGRGFFNSAPSAPVVYAQQPQPYPAQYAAPAAQYAAPRYQTQPNGSLYLPPPNGALAAASLY